MSYIEKNLLNGEQVVYKANIHWCIFILPLISVLVGVFLISSGESFFMFLGYILLIFNVLILINRLLYKSSSEFVVTNKRVILKSGFIKRETLELMLNKSEGIKVTQGIWGRILGFGSLVVTTGGASNSFNMIVDPQRFRKEINEQIEKSA